MMTAVADFAQPRVPSPAEYADGYDAPLAYTYACARCDKMEMRPTRKPPEGWDVFYSQGGIANITCPDCNERIETAFQSISVTNADLGSPPPVTPGLVSGGDASDLGPSIMLRSGNLFYFLWPRQSHFTIEDIAHNLSHICRFSGATSRFYSVAQHSVLASYNVHPDQALAALMHDAAEAFLGDVTSPLKSLLPEYRRLENDAQAAIVERFGIRFDKHPSIKAVDSLLLLAEQVALMPSQARIDKQLGSTIEIDPWSPDLAKHRFLSRYHFLKSERHPL